MTAPISPVVVERRHAPAPSRSVSNYPNHIGAHQTSIPEPAALALAAIVRDMRDVPRDCFVDRAEMITWLNRMARRVEGVATMKLPEPARARPSGPARLSRTAAPTARQAAEAVFASPSRACAAKGLKDETLCAASTQTASRCKVPGRNVEARTVTSRKGRAVPVEVRRARAAGQMELGV